MAVRSPVAAGWAPRTRPPISSQLAQQVIRSFGTLWPSEPNRMRSIPSGNAGSTNTSSRSSMKASHPIALMRAILSARVSSKNTRSRASPKPAGSRKPCAVEPAQRRLPQVDPLRIVGRVPGLVADDEQLACRVRAPP